MSRLLFLLPLVFLAVAISNNIPAVVFVASPLLTLMVLCFWWFETDTERLLAVCSVCLVYGGLSAQYYYAASLGLLGVAVLALKHYTKLSAMMTVIILGLIVQGWFLIFSQSKNTTVIVGLSLQLVVILGLSLWLKRGAKYARHKSISNPTR